MGTNRHARHLARLDRWLQRARNALQMGWSDKAPNTCGSLVTATIRLFAPESESQIPSPTTKRRADSSRAGGNADHRTEADSKPLANHLLITGDVLNAQSV